MKYVLIAIVMASLASCKTAESTSSTESVRTNAMKINYSLDCKVLNPAAHQKDLGYVSRAVVAQTGERKGTLRVSSRASIGSEEVRLPREFKDGNVTFQKLTDGSTGLQGVSGSWDEGDTWIKVEFDSRKKAFVGDMTIDEDFGYQVSCSVGLRVLE